MKYVRIIRFGIITGTFIGFMSALFFSWLYGANNLYPSSPQFVEQFSNNLIAITVSAVIWALMGVVFSTAQMIFEVESWSITKQTVWHFITTYTGYTILAILAGWFPLNFWYLLQYTLIFVVVYIIIWLISMYVARRNVAKLNQELLK
ncbi:DUF3021 domain-containing protein [Convivina praedatoris]|uniref:DUF3021 domain-containing protein n=1 Tax=Convivina praedatoris TaxID=2880963 RepID=A0ABN8HAP5_9LACO|nr:DUF3021 domain-containing protein [Convivina sp. LMG 32447]CAH1852137.1 hypothetical protein LMG032447_00503 [Convivina sp. LMG 32447]CAH1852170.1 hypothetical protein R078138_00513 [Convivina sp. LMG 32447]CAH1852773.1 hypothetical protein R077815_00604 [Convivina sp. LMG 32447]